MWNERIFSAEIQGNVKNNERKLFSEIQLLKINSMFIAHIE